MLIQYRLIHFVYIQLKHGLSFFGHVEVRLFLADPTGWWVEAVFDNNSQPVPADWSQHIKEAIEADKAISSDITSKCVREAARIK